MDYKNETIFAPSILSADFSRISDAVILAEKADSGVLHMDVMDGVFVPNLTFGHKMVADIRDKTRLPLDVHLMVVNPEQHLPRFAEAGADYITFHLEACIHSHRCIQQISSLGKKPGISIVPSTPVSALSEILHLLDIVLIMTVNPGFGGQKMIPECLQKVEQLKELRKKNGYSYKISVDGGIDRNTSTAVLQAGADILVCGSAFFTATDPLLEAEIILGKKRI